MRRIELFCFLMIFVAGTVMAAEKPKGKVKVKTKTVNKKEIGYSIEPILLDTLRLPKNYIGHNLSTLYNALLESGYNVKRRDEFETKELYDSYNALERTNNTKTKDEFETTSEYEKRLKADKDKPLIGKTLGINDVYAFSVKPESTYDADKKHLTIAINRIKKLISHMSPAEHISGIWGTSNISELGTYVGTNSYGAKLTIKSSFADIPVLAFDNDIPFKTIAKRQDAHNLPSGQTIDTTYRAVVDSFNENKIETMERDAKIKQMHLD